MNLSRTVVVGTSGSGKTTFARDLARRLDVPAVELDALHWLPGWQERGREDFHRLVDAATAAPAWVVDGNYSRTRPLTWGRATTVVWLNYGFPVVFARAFRRTVARGVTREELWSGNRESLARSLFTRDSILWWVITTHRRRQREMRALFDGPDWPGLARVELRNPRAADRFLAGVGRGMAEGRARV